MITFDPIKHEYFLNNKKVPSVTQILSSLNDFSNVSPEVLNHAKDLGTGVHLACELSDRKDLLELPEIYRGYLRNWNKFLNEMNVEIIEDGIEKIVYSEKLRYAGRIDRLGIVKNKLTIIDIKSGQKNPVFALQLAGYGIALNEMGTKAKSRMTVYLKPEGYKVEEYKNPADDAIFLSVLNIYNWKINNKIKEN